MLSLYLLHFVWMQYRMYVVFQDHAGLPINYPQGKIWVALQQSCNLLRMSPAKSYQCKNVKQAGAYWSHGYFFLNKQIKKIDVCNIIRQTANTGAISPTTNIQTVNSHMAL